MLSSAKSLIFDLMWSLISLMYNRNKAGLNTEPWGTPDVMSAHDECVPLTDTTCCRSDRKLFIHPSVYYPWCHKNSACWKDIGVRLCQKLCWSLKSMTSVWPFLFSVSDQSFVELGNCVTVGRHSRKPCWSSIKSCVSSDALLDGLKQCIPWFCSTDMLRKWVYNLRGLPLIHFHK